VAATAKLVESWHAMPRYFFHVERDGEQITDHEGSNLSDLESVLTLARRAAADLAADDLKHGAQSLEQFILVENESGQDVVRVRVVARLEVETPLSASLTS
jgi:hypothetical protein